MKKPKWIKFTGNKCPVHPLTTVRLKYAQGDISESWCAQEFVWGFRGYEPIRPDRVVAYCVIKPYLEKKNIDPRIDPVALYVCDLFDDSWTPNKKSYRAWAKEILKIADGHKA